MNIFKEIKEIFRGETVDSLCSQLQTMGIDAKLRDRTANKLMKIGGSIGCIKVDGQNFDAIQVSRNGMGYPTLPYVWFEFHFMIQIDLNMPMFLKAKTKQKKKGIIYRELVDVQWVGSQLADNLNHDSELKKILLQMFKEQKNLKIIINPMIKNGFVIITKTPIGTRTFSPYPMQITHFDINLFNSISVHIHDLIKAQSNFQQ